MELTSKRLLLRPWKKEDATSLFILASNPNVARYMTWSSHKNVKQSEECIAGVLCGPENYAITLKKTGELIGNIALIIGSNSEIAIPDFEASLGCWLGERYWGNRYIEEAYELIEERAKQIGLRKLYWNHHEDNLASAKAAKRCRFKKEDWVGKILDNQKRPCVLIINSKALV